MLLKQKIVESTPEQAINRTFKQVADAPRVGSED